MSEDPIGLAGGQANLYAYPADSPTNLGDPLGLCGSPLSNGGLLRSAIGRCGALNTVLFWSNFAPWGPELRLLEERALELRAAQQAAQRGRGLLSRLKSANWRDETGSIRFGRAAEHYGGQLTESQAMEAAAKWLGPGYKEVSPGRFVSADGQRVVRYGDHETRGTVQHIHFEAIENGFVVENTWVEIIP
jgi:hypothetical protein